MEQTGAIGEWRAYAPPRQLLRPHSHRLLLGRLVSPAGPALSWVQPFSSELLIDRALLQKDFHALVWIAGLLFVATVAGFGLNIFSSYRYVTVSAAMLFDMRLALFRHLQGLSPRFYVRYRLGDLMSR